MHATLIARINLDGSAAGANLKVSVEDNSIHVLGRVSVGIQFVYASGKIASNFIICLGVQGVSDEGTSGPMTISGNTILGGGPSSATLGIDSGPSPKGNIGPEVYTGNFIIDQNLGFGLPFGSPTISNNTVMNSFIGFGVGCDSATLTGNTVNNSQYGMAAVPTTGFSATGKISFYNVDQFIENTLVYLD